MKETLSLSLVASQYNGYPGDKVTLSTRVVASESVAEFMLEVEVAAGFAIEAITQTPSAVSAPRHRLGEKHMVRWRVVNPFVTCDFEINVRILPDGGHVANSNGFADEAPDQHDAIALSAHARLADLATKQNINEILFIHVAKQAASLRFLPAIYEQDTFLNQLLMLTESYLKPIQQQLDQIDHYFDPMLTPARLLPWLASWFDWEFDQDWPLEIDEQEAWQRKLIKRLLYLHRTRGTELGLQTYLELYFGLEGGKVKIQPYTLQMLKLSERTQLGRGFALYKEEHEPHTFAVTITMPSAFTTNQPGIDLVKERAKRIIAAEKPAHTVLTQLDVVIEALTATN